MYKLAIVAALATVVTAGSKNKCPWVMGKFPFDDQKFAGEWKAYAGTTVLQQVPNCGKFDYQVNKDGHYIVYTGKLDDGKAVKGEAYAQPLFGKVEKSATLLASWRKEGDSFSGVFKQSIVATDYDNYALLVACKTNFDDATKTFTRELKGGILSRPGVTLSADTVAVLTNILSSFDIEPEAIKMVDHTKC